ncbi:VOC family protein [Gloeothece verrucosa]|uniref:Glyoxalase/bleomycin resistance protein/dioxygenase n=1 Tax=Gloeothece verrucosa (strain PCC 7822) TaxID=497965 RepID=E0ULL0_GLOV7|nr:VOC family protein [Gloeothece verrucosa]ADN17840.1 Glyoxalase/bleomycin resistance protein/dioxygenase [Gloeothece verrucosa PCC 7822]
MADLGLTHLAIEVSNIDKSIAFYEKYARMKVVHRRSDQTIQSDVAWISDLTRPFVIVLLKMPSVKAKLVPNFHFGVAVESRLEVDRGAPLRDRLWAAASEEGILLDGPDEAGPPVGYWAYIQDPDGHTLEISYGQEVRFTVEQAAKYLDKNKVNCEVRV